MNYLEAINYLDKVSEAGYKPDIKNMYNILKEINNPQDDMKVIHVAGTNGKGSTCTMLNNILIENGNKVGLYTSPYILKYEETITVNNQVISEVEFAKYVKLIRDKCNCLVQKGFNHPTVFEIITGLAIKYMKDCNVDVFVCEVGLGGQEDATNVFNNPILSILTSISEDHTSFLGDSIEEITKHKAGIIKSNCSVILGPNSYEVQEVVKDKCVNENATLMYVNPKDTKFELVIDSIEHSVINIKNKYFDYDNIVMPIKGKHRIDLLTTVLTSVQYLKNVIKINEIAIYEGIKKTKIPCRIEHLEINSKTYILDGSHNLEGVESFCYYINKYYSDKKIVLIYGVLHDKPYEKMTDKLLEIADEVIITEPNSDRALNVDLLQNTINRREKTKIYSDYKLAVEYAMNNTDIDSIICCIGSFYLVYYVRHILLGC